MERAIPGTREAMHEALLNPEFQAALDDFDPVVEPVEQPVEIQDVELREAAPEPAEEGELIDLDFASLVDEVEAEGAGQIVPAPRPDAGEGMQAAPVINPFALLVNPATAYAAAKRLESVGLPRRTLFLFGKKGPAAGEASRFDAEDDADDEQEMEEATVALPLPQ